MTADLLIPVASFDTNQRRDTDPLSSLVPPPH
jgi:hypothetical protein